MGAGNFQMGFFLRYNTIMHGGLMIESIPGNEMGDNPSEKIIMRTCFR